MVLFLTLQKGEKVCPTCQFPSINLKNLRQKNEPRIVEKFEKSFAKNSFTQTASI